MATATDDTDLDTEIARKKAQDAEQYLSEQLDSEDAGDDSGNLEEEETPKQAAALSSGPKRKAPNYVLTPVDVPKPQDTAPPLTIPAPLDTKVDEQVTAPTPEMPKLETKTDEQVVAPLDQGEAPTALPQVERGQLVKPQLDQGEAPAQLPQVERATLVKLPAPDLGERGLLSPR